ARTLRRRTLGVARKWFRDARADRARAGGVADRPCRDGAGPGRSDQAGRDRRARAGTAAAGRGRARPCGRPAPGAADAIPAIEAWTATGHAPATLARPAGRRVPGKRYRRPACRTYTGRWFSTSAPMMTDPIETPAAEPAAETKHRRI